MNDLVLRSLHLCSGYAGMELALRLADVRSRTVAHVERDSHAAATLVARMEDQALDQAPVWSDLLTFDGRPWRGRVDLVTAGFPCQPWSAAGLKGGVDDDRWLWPEIARIVGEVGPRLVFLENVPGLNAVRWDRAGMQYVLQDLADLGFDVEWGLLSASAVGAPHGRERLWILAHTDLEGLRLFRRCLAQPEERHPDRSGGADVGDAAGPRHLGHAGVEHGRQAEHDLGPTQAGDLADDPGQAVADAEGIDEREPYDETRPVPRRDAWHDAGRGGPWPPLPDDVDGWERWIAAGGPEPQVRRSTDGRPVGLADALHLGGNGLVPRVAAAALLQLAQRAEIQRLTEGMR